MPHQLFFTSIPRWCGTSARGAGPPSALGVRLAEHPPGVGEPLAYNPSVPLARIIHERSVFVNNAPAGAGSAAPAGFDPAAAAGLKASPERRPANAGRSRSPKGRLFTSM